MHGTLRALIGTIAASALFAAAAHAAPPCPQCGLHKLPACDVVTHRCQLVPETRQIKKTVYEVKEVPFCLHKLPPLLSHLRHCGDACPECECPRYKKVLLKREIVCCEVCELKCIVEKASIPGPSCICPAAPLRCTDTLPPLLDPTSPLIPLPPLPTPDARRILQ